MALWSLSLLRPVSGESTYDKKDLPGVPHPYRNKTTQDNLIMEPNPTPAHLRQAMAKMQCTGNRHLSLCIRHRIIRTKPTATQTPEN